MKQPPECPVCGPEGRLVKAGRNRSGTQRYKCICGHIYTPIRKRKPHPELAHLAAALMYQAGFNLEEIATVLSVSIQAAHIWVQRYQHHISVKIEATLYELKYFTQLANRHRQSSTPNRLSHLLSVEKKRIT